MPLEQATQAPTAKALIDEARRQIEICNACRYCEGFCSVFPAITRQRTFADGDITQLANLCHNCRGCYYACQYTEPHEFAINMPRALAEVRAKSWERFAWPGFLADRLQRSGVAISVALIIGFTALFWAGQALKPDTGEGFYAVMSHSVMISIFTPAFLIPLLAVFVGLRSYWKEVDGRPVSLVHLAVAFADVAVLRNLSGGAAEGCNFEKGDRFTNIRRWYHQAVMYGFLLCLASTSSATLMHYLLNMPAPYGLFSVPKLLGIPGGLLLTFGALGMAVLKMQGEKTLGAPAHWGGEMAFVLLLSFTGGSGLALYGATGSPAVSILLPLHLGAVLTLFLLTPYSKMVHGFFRLAALVRNAQQKM